MFPDSLNILRALRVTNRSILVLLERFSRCDHVELFVFACLVGVMRLPKATEGTEMRDSRCDRDDLQRVFSMHLFDPLLCVLCVLCGLVFPPREGELPSKA